MGLWDKFVVPPLISCACATKPIMKQREKVVPRAEGHVLEVGCGSGTNFEFYDPAKIEKLYALEPSSGMMQRAKKAAADLGWAGRIEFLETGAESLPLEDDSIDTAVITFVLCTIPDWSSSLAEVKRVLKPGGTVLFSEHGLSPDQGVAKWQKRVERFWKPLAGGCRLTRDARAMLGDAGFVLEDVETMYLPNTPKIAGYVTWGTARAA
jgi:ubiquinone/menaquinone biosynthesis C-methylase UbiE